MPTKQIHFKVPQHLYEQFHRLFPARGEKTIFFRRIMEFAILKAPSPSDFIQGIWNEAEETYQKEEMK